MKIRYSKFRTFLLAFAFGLAIVSIYARVAGYLEEAPVDLPEVQSDSPIIIRVCPEFGQKSYQENGYRYFSKEKAVNCSVGGGAG